MVTKKPVRKSAMKNVTSKKMIAKKRPATKAPTTRKPAVKSKSYKKAPVKRTIEKKMEVSKPLGLLVIAGGIMALFLLFVYAIPVFFDSDGGDKPVLGVKVNGKPVNKAFTDPSFYACVLDSLNHNKIDGKSNRTYSYNATDSELRRLNSLNCIEYQIYKNNEVYNASGLYKLTGITDLTIRSGQMKTIDLSKNIALMKVDLNSNKLSNIDVSKNKKLYSLDVSYNNLSSVSVYGNTKLEHLRLDNNKAITGINITNNKMLSSFSSNFTNLTSINTSNNPKLAHLQLKGNKITTLDLRNNPALKSLLLMDVYNTLKTVKSFTAPRYVIDTNYTSVSGVDKDIRVLLSNIKVSAGAKAYVINRGTERTAGVFQSGDKLLVKYPNNGARFTYALYTSNVRGYTK